MYLNLSKVPQLSELGVKQTILPHSRKLIFEKDETIIGEGNLNCDTNLIEVKIETTEPQQEALTAQKSDKDEWITVHKKLGHLGKEIMIETVKCTNGLQPLNRFEPLNCQECLQTKRKRKSKSKKASKRQHELLETVEIDIQGPFPVIGVDNTQNNVKIVDKASGWIHFETIPDKTAHTLLEVFLKFKNTIEKVTGKFIKHVRGDQGKEFMGEFQEFLRQSGIIQQSGIAYDHSYPGQVERSHQTILHMARAMLKDSKLPASYYTEAMECASYILNRTKHGSLERTPFESVFGYKPELKIGRAHV